jgi:hypothetical protein
MRRFLTLIATALSLGVSAQNVNIRQVELAGEKIIIHYDLEDANTNHEFLLNVFSSKDNFTAPLAKVTGDVGQEVKPGTNKKITWDIIREYGGYKGKLALEIRGKAYVPFVKLQNFETEKAYKRGKTYMLTTKVGNTNPINVELYKGGERISSETNHPNNGSYALSIPSNAKKGDDYRLKITDAKSTDDVIYSPFFKVRPKLPLLLKVLPIVVIGGAVAALGGGGKKDNGGGSSSSGGSKLPDPPLPN